MASDVVQIITDSTCALPPDLDPAVAASIRVVRTAVQFHNETWLEGDFALDDFYARVEQGEIARSSQPPPDEFLREYRAAAPHGPVLVITLSAALSGTYSTAQAMVAEVPEADIELFDSQYFSSPLGYMVAEAATMAHGGATRADIVARLRERQRQMVLYFTIQTLEYLRRGGRANVVQVGVASLFDIKPVMTVTEGRLEVVGRVRSRRRSLESLLGRAVEAAEGWSGPLWGSVVHGAAREEAHQLQSQLAERVELERCFIHEIPAVIAVHGGPGAIGIMLTPAELVPERSYRMATATVHSV